MICFPLGLRFAGTVFLSAATLVHAVDPYQSRLDREYKSLSGAISRAYAVPPPRPTTPTRSYTAPSYSSSSTSRSSSSSSSSYSRPSSSLSYAQTLRSFEQERTSQQQRYTAASPARAVDTVAIAAAHRRAELQQARDARERFLKAPSHTASAWARLRDETKGKAPLVAPPNSALLSRPAEFAYFLGIAQARGTAAPWENLRVGQLCLLFQGAGATPSRAFGFFVQSNPAWPEVQLGLGLCYLRGYGVAADPAKAREFLEKAAAWETPKALSVSYTGGGDAFQDIAYQACRELAVAYDLGQGLPPDAALASDWYGRAQSRPLYTRDYDEIRALKREFWKRNASRARELLERDFAAAKGGASPKLTHTLFADLVAAGDAPALHAIGDFADTRTWDGQETTTGRSGISYFLAAAKLGHDAAARAYFSPAKNGFYNRDLDGDAFWKEHADFVRERWSHWEKLWLAAAAAGDAAANIPLAFHYSGARGNAPDATRASRHAALMPATMPAKQRAAIQQAIAYAGVRENEAWAKTVWAKLGTTYDKVDLTRLSVAPHVARGEALRAAGLALARTSPTQARDHWRDAAALGDLPAQVQLYFYAQRNRIYLGNYYRSLQIRLEAVARAGDVGAMAALAVLMDGNPHNNLAFPSASYDIGQEWRAKARQHSPENPRWLAIAEDPALSDAHCASVRAAVLRETAAWHAHAQTWGLVGQRVIDELTVSDEELRTVDGRRAQFVALAAAALQLKTQLALWEKSVERKDYDPEADARFIQGYEAWQGNDEAERDITLAVDYFSQSVGLGQPIAPLVLAYLFGSGFGGFPVDAAVSLRFRALTDARLTAMAENGDTWAQTMLGAMLFNVKGDRANDPLRPGAYEWLPPDRARGRQWLHAAAEAAAYLPANFGDSAGQSVAWYLSQRYYDAEDRPAYAKWKLIDEVFRWGDEDSATPLAAWTKATTIARTIINEDPAAERARAELDAAIDDAETPALRVAALGRRALARLATGIDTLALVDADLAVNLATTNPTAWKILAQVQQSAGQAPAAAVSLSLAQAFENDATAPARFEAAFAKLPPEKQRSIRERLSDTLEDQPDSALLKTLVARAVKFSPPK